MKKTYNFLLLTTIIFFAIMLSNYFNSNSKTVEVHLKKQEVSLRFQEVETILFRDGVNSVSGIIYRDTETNIKYLYIYRQGYQAGITRLWDK